MNAIHNLNVSNGFSEFAFEPANEPNGEWYVGSQITSYIAWQDMDSYFSALYDYVHNHYSGINVLTPPMAQGNYAETKRFESCTSMEVSAGQSGYDFMQNTYTTKMMAIVGTTIGDKRGNFGPRPVILALTATMFSSISRNGCKLKLHPVENHPLSPRPTFCLHVRSAAIQSLTRTHTSTLLKNRSGDLSPKSVAPITLWRGY